MTAMSAPTAMGRENFARGIGVAPNAIAVALHTSNADKSHSNTPSRGRVMRTARAASPEATNSRVGDPMYCPTESAEALLLSEVAFRKTAPRDTPVRRSLTRYFLCQFGQN